MTRPVLVIDDNGDARVLASRVLRHLAEQAVCVTSGAEAIEFLGDERPKLVRLDLDMPEMDGMAVLRQIRGNPRLAGLPVVVFSAATENALLAAVACGADDFRAERLVHRGRHPVPREAVARGGLHGSTERPNRWHAELILPASGSPS